MGQRERLPDCFRLKGKGPTEAHRQESRPLCLAPQMGSVRHSSDNLKLLSQELREVKSALTGSRVLNPQ